MTRRARSATPRGASAPPRAKHPRARGPARAAPRRRAGPPAPWGSFPLSELVILVGIVLILWGAARGSGGEEMLVAGLVIASLGGGELALREHMARLPLALEPARRGGRVRGRRRVVALGLGPVQVWVLFVLGVGVFGATFYAMRELFKRRSGGLGFR